MFVIMCTKPFVGVCVCTGELRALKYCVINLMMVLKYEINYLNSNSNVGVFVYACAVGGRIFELGRGGRGLGIYTFIF
jgi:hypothetical protein